MRAAFGVPVGLSDHTLGIARRRRPPSRWARARREALHARPLDARARPPVRARARRAARPGRRTSATPRPRSATARSAGPSTPRREEMYRQGAPRRSSPRPTSPRHGDHREMLTVKRPGYGVKPKFIELLVGRVARARHRRRRRRHLGHGLTPARTGAAVSRQGGFGEDSGQDLSSPAGVARSPAARPPAARTRDRPRCPPSSAARRDPGLPGGWPGASAPRCAADHRGDVLAVASRSPRRRRPGGRRPRRPRRQARPDRCVAPRC